MATIHGDCAGSIADTDGDCRSWQTARASTRNSAVAADGRDSPARQAAGIPTSARRYPQSALVLNFRPQPRSTAPPRPNSTPRPARSRRCRCRAAARAWSGWCGRKRPKNWRLSTMPRCRVRVERSMQSMLGRVTVEPGRQVYPLSAMAAGALRQGPRSRWSARPRTCFRRSARKGLNLGIRDVEESFVRQRKSRRSRQPEPALAAYDRRRRPDILARSTAVNLLNISLLSDMLPAQMARSAGLGRARRALRRCARSSCARACSPAAASPVFSSLREQVRR